MFNLNQFLKDIVPIGVSDIHLRVHEAPTVRKDGIILKTNLPNLSKADLEIAIEGMLPDNAKINFNQITDLDFTYILEGVSRFRVNFAKSMNNPMIVMRTIPFEIPSFQSMGLPDILRRICQNSNGLVCVTGPTGSGKSTTLAAMLDTVNTDYAKHIITLEDPIEYLHNNKKSIFSQRQIGQDCKDYPSGIKYSLRQDPDIILVGEIRDRDTAQQVLSAAETGHLVFTTLHTSDAISTVNRIVNFFAPHEREQVRMQLADVLRATIAQKLLPKVDESGRVPAFEILLTTPSIKDYIIKDQLDNVYSLLKEGKYSDMITLNMYLTNLVNDGIISQETAMEASENKNELEHTFKGKFH